MNSCRRKPKDGVVSDPALLSQVVVTDEMRVEAEMARVQEELANETLEASAGGGVVTVKATGASEIAGITIAPEAIDPDDPELLADMILGAVKALPSANSVAQSRLGGMTGGRGLPGRLARRA